MCPILKDPNSESSSDAKNIPVLVQKRWKVLSGATYRKKLVYENGQPLYPINCDIPSSNRNPWSMMVIIVWYNVI
jgi:hypothetical protein